MASEAFIYRRWSTQQKQYVDLQGHTLHIPRSKTQPASSPLGCDLSARPPKDGSSPFLALPSELRLEIYGYLVASIPAHSSKVPWIVPQAQNGKRSRYAYLWRSPGRINQPFPASKDALALLQVCRLVRHELLDVAFRDTIFVLEASLYHRTIAGLWTLPCVKTLPLHWVQRLLIATVLDLGASHRRMGNLLLLQEMISLREIRIVAAVKTPRSSRVEQVHTSLMSEEAERTLAPISAIMECIPASARVTFEVGSTVDSDLRQYLGASIDYLCKDEMLEETTDAIKSALPIMQQRQGVLSGCSYDHSQCLPSECGSGIGCVNSRWMPSLGATARPLQDNNVP